MAKSPRFLIKIRFFSLDLVHCRNTIGGAHKKILVRTWLIVTIFTISAKACIHANVFINMRCFRYFSDVRRRSLIHKVGNILGKCFNTSWEHITDLYKWAIPEGGREMGYFCFGIGNGLMKAGPRKACLFYLSPVHIKTFLLQLEKHLVPFVVTFSYLIPDVLPNSFIAITPKIRENLKHLKHQNYLKHIPH